MNKYFDLRAAALVAALLVALLSLIGCSAPLDGKAMRLYPRESQTAAESASELFTLDGVTVYRFFDAGRFHYYAVSKGEIRIVVE